MPETFNGAFTVLMVPDCTKIPEFKLPLEVAPTPIKFTGFVALAPVELIKVLPPVPLI